MMIISEIAKAVKTNIKFVWQVVRVFYINKIRQQYNVLIVNSIFTKENWVIIHVWYVKRQISEILRTKN